MADENSNRKRWIDRVPQGSAPLVAGGIGIGTLLSTVLHSRPDIVPVVVSWGPGIVVLAIGAFFVQSLATPFIQSQAAIAQNMGDLAGAIRQSLNRDDDVREAVRTLTAHMEKQHEAVIREIREMRETNGQ